MADEVFQVISVEVSEQPSVEIETVSVLVTEVDLLVPPPTLINVTLPDVVPASVDVTLLQVPFQLAAHKNLRQQRNQQEQKTGKRIHKLLCYTRSVRN